MGKIIDKISSLSKEKRKDFFEKLKDHIRQEGKGNRGFSLEREVKCEKNSLEQPDDIVKGDNFCCNISTPGMLGSIKFRKIDLLPPEPNQVQIEARAIGINFRDLMIGLGLYPSNPDIPFFMGSDYSGIVTDVGEETSEFKPGDEVIALSGTSPFIQEEEIISKGHFSSSINVFPDQVVYKPKNINFYEAATIPTVFLTSYYALYFLAQLKKDEKILIHSATGGVGLAAIQMAQEIGAEIFSTAGSVEKRDYLKSLGIIKIMNSRTLSFSEEIMEMTRGQGVDVVLNLLSGQAIQHGLNVLREFGRFIHIDKKDIYGNSSLELKMFKKGITFSILELSLFLKQSATLKKLLKELIVFFEAGTFQPLPYQLFPIWEVGNVLTQMSHAKHIGKFVLDLRA